MTVAIDTALTSIFVSRMVLHIRGITSPHCTMINGDRSLTTYPQELGVTVMSLSTKPTGVTSAHYDRRHSHHNDHRRESVGLGNEFGDRVVAQRDSMWTVPPRHEKRDEEDGKYETEGQTWEMDVVRMR
jgi:hypothetical protein